MKDIEETIEHVDKRKISKHIEEIKITVVIRATNGYHGEVLTFLKWEDLPFHVYSKYIWYFRYRHALVRVAHPRAQISFNCIKEDIDHRTLKEKRYKRLKSSWASAKGQVTKFQSQLDEAKNNWTEVFPIEDHPHWGKIIEKLKTKKENEKKAHQEYLEAKEDYEKEREIQSNQ